MFVPAFSLLSLLYTAANILSVASFPGSAVAIDSAVFADFVVPWVPADVMISVVAGVPAVSGGVHVVTRVSAVVSVLSAVYIPSP